MRHGFRSIILAAVMLAPACGGDSPTPPPAPAPSPTPSPAPTPTPTPGPVTIVSSFAAGFDSWQASYSDYSLGQEATIGFISGHERLPVPLEARSGVFLASDNRSDDVFMYLWRPVTGLAPNRRYRIDLTIAFATNAPPGCAGAGGAPGESVYIKAGASPRAPVNEIASGKVTVNVDKGNQSQSGTEVVSIGDFAQEEPSATCTDAPYQNKALSTGASGPFVTSDGAGRLWLVIGTDSGSEGHTRVYFLEVEAVLTPA